MLFLGSGLAGVGAGLASCLACIYVAEVAPAEVRGEFLMVVPLAATTGVLLAHCASLLFGMVEGGAWRWQLGLLLPPSLGVLALQHLLVETPRWLLAAGRGRIVAKSALRRLHPMVGELALDGELEVLAAAAGPKEPQASGLHNSFFWRHRWRLGLALGVCTLPHLCGIHVEYYSSPTLRVVGCSPQTIVVVNL